MLVSMHLKVLVPTEVFVDTKTTKIVAEAENGSFCLLPHHIDFVAALVPGIVVYPGMLQLDVCIHVTCRALD